MTGEQSERIPLLVLFGSQTGSAQDVAERIGREAKLRQYAPRVMAMDAFDVRLLPEESLVIFVTSTTGQGELPSNMKQSWRFLLRKNLPADSLAGLAHAVFGLGDSGYVQYNVVAKKLTRRLAALGGRAVIEQGLGDDQHPHGYEAALDPWLACLWAALRTEYPLPPGAGYGPWRPYMARVLKNERITAEDHFQDTRHIEVDLGDSGLAYQPGDLLAVFPQQRESALQDFLHRTRLDPDDWVRIQPADPAARVASADVEVRVAALVAGVMDVAGASPRRFFFEVLRCFTRDRAQAERLAYFASPAGREDLSKYNEREGRTALEVLQDFEDATPPLEWLLQAMPRLKPRYFSIASSPRAHPGQAHITAAVVEYATPHRRRKLGVATSWLAGLQPGSPEARVPVWVEPGVMRPPDSDRPMVLIGPGTGVAPFRAFLEDRLAASAQEGAAPVAPSYLYFGCRNEAKDFYYRSFWELSQRSGVLADPGGLVTAFSRDQASKVYVSHRVRETSAQLWAALQQGAVVFVCGSAKKMPQDIAAAFERVCMQEGGMTKAEAAKYMKQLEMKGRYIVEAWS
ncbi:riboflavin synthase domain-like protein [Coccomyxa subellipsoidea C-169]|uniref:NADPH-dependent diflavin oxidoreductase 1 n=1 Tax=Coccomyxa subellipsoidea (strain C-169) TaxID=574566 RepID=I0Z7Z6_COCSC|nr:riboflavin synthase domain-like protein [Coccomyxa subellipsoidea C-169]EIE26765.1 riboflavin synthase domain-like protein [Coccomyxa subellipsoidea C-169]|eukprot:XP_005651309.1 riboflavin synthase domain-like protein [Coccomyxa subellipsoidea C-169]